MMSRHVWLFALGAFLTPPLQVTPLSAQEVPKGCTASALANPPRQLLRCPDLTIEAESGAALKPIDADRDGRPEAVDLGGRAVLIEVVPGRTRSFKVQTPHAIASVRGTIYAVDVEAARSSVFVVRGRVAVTKPGSRGAVTLGPGEGVDVEAAMPLDKKTWGAARASALLARFAR